MKRHIISSIYDLDQAKSKHKLDCLVFYYKPICYIFSTKIYK